MTAGRRLLYFGSFVCLAATAALAAGHSCRTSIASLLVVSAIAASVAGAPGLVRWRAWPLVFVLLPLGAYLLARAQVTPPADVGGAGGQMGYLLDQTADGVGLYQGDRFPLDVAGKPELALILSLAVYLIVGLAAFATLSRRRAVLGIAMLLALPGFGLTVDDSDKAILSTVAFVVFSGCLLVTSLSLERRRLRPTGLLAGAAAGLGAALLALVVVSVTPVAAGQPWMAWESIGEAPSLTFEWMENYPGLLDPETDATVMRVAAPVPSYWRANALDSFDGVAWSSSTTIDEGSSPLSRSASSVYQVPPDVAEPPGRLVSETFSLESVSTDYLFVGGSPRSVRLDGTAPLRMTPQRALGTGSLLGPKLTYTVTAWVPTVTPADLERIGPSYPPDIEGPYTDLPFPSLADLAPFLTIGGPGDESAQSWDEEAWDAAVTGAPALEEWSPLYRLNQEIVGEATGPYEVTLAIRDYLQADYAYSLEPPESDMRSPYAAFLFDTKTGYCQHFAGAMAVLLRFNGIPARVGVGFASGDRGQDGVFVVSRNDAHAWVEVYFSGLGWLPFDPTPGRSVPGRSDPSPSPSPSASVSPNSPSPSPSPRSASPSPRESARDKAPVGSTGGRPGAGPGERDWLVPTIAASVVVGALVAWPTGRALRRRRALRRGDCETRLRTSVEQLYHELGDWNIEVPESQTFDETVRFLRASLGIDASEIVERLQAVLYGGRAATPADVAGVAALRHVVRRRLREQRGRTQAVLALYGLNGWNFRLPVPEPDSAPASAADG